MNAGREEALIIIILASRDPTLIFGHTVCPPRLPFFQFVCGDVARPRKDSSKINEYTVIP